MTTFSGEDRPTGQDAALGVATLPLAASAGSNTSPAQPATLHSPRLAVVTAEQRYRMIQDAAYFIAERHAFAGDSHGYWLEAEQAIDRQLTADASH